MGERTAPLGGVTVFTKLVSYLVEGAKCSPHEGRDRLVTRPEDNACAVGLLEVRSPQQADLDVSPFAAEEPSVDLRLALELDPSLRIRQCQSRDRLQELLGRVGDVRRKDLCLALVIGYLAKRPSVMTQRPSDRERTHGTPQLVAALYFDALRLPWVVRPWLSLFGAAGRW